MLLGACWCTIGCVPSYCAQRHDAVLVLRLWLLPRPGCKEGAGGTLPPAVLVRAFVSGRVVRAVMRVWAGSQPLRDLSPPVVSYNLEVRFPVGRGCTQYEVPSETTSYFVLRTTGKQFSQWASVPERGLKRALGVSGVEPRCIFEPSRSGTWCITSTRLTDRVDRL